MTLVSVRPRLRDQTLVAKGEVGWEFRRSRCKLLYVTWKINRTLLCNTGNYIRYPVIKHYGKEH